MKNKKFKKYFKEYQWSNILAMIRNNSRKPKLCKEDFRGKLVVITGATSGIGYLTARKFASRGANLVCINRNVKKSEALKAEIEKDFNVKCDYIIADLSNLKDIYSASEKLNKLDIPVDILIHNAGIYLTRRELTSEGFDKVFVVHYLSSFMINILLSEKLKSEGRARIIMVSSEGHRFAPWGLHLDDLNWERHSYSGLKSYGSAKLAQLLSMIIFSEYFKPYGVTINAMHPGAVRSGTGQENGPVYRWIKKHLFDKLLRPTEISAESLYFLSVSPEIEGVTGKFFNLTAEEEPAPPALDKEEAYNLWEISLQMTGVQDIIR
jgi:NAD(P)-dependent dehydrogenase (short-subunit alcohol dehydrogenase family)